MCTMSTIDEGVSRDRAGRGVDWVQRRLARFGLRRALLAGLPALELAGAVLALAGLLWAGLLLMVLAFGGGYALAWRNGRRAAILGTETARLQHLADARSDRVSALSHEIRTPLAMIKGAADLLLEGNPGPLTPQQLTFLQTITQNCAQTISLAEDLLMQARIEAGLFKLRVQQVDFKVLVRQTVRDHRAYAAEREQYVSLDCPQVMARISADPRLLTQALNNLLQNASRHTTHGGHIYVSVADNDSGLVVSVTDDGAGMSSEERSRLFQKFASGRPLGDGTGLGLIITKQIIELHGGQIMVDTNLGRGTTVLFTLPRWKEPQDGQTASPGG